MRYLTILILLGCGDGVPEADASDPNPVDADFLPLDMADRDMNPENPDAGPPVDSGRPPVPDMGRPPSPDLGADHGLDSGPPDMGPRDSGPPDLGTDSGPPDSGPPDMGPPSSCSGSRRVDLPTPSGTEWTATRAVVDRPTLDARGDLYRLERYRLGLRVTAADPRSRITVIAVCPVSVQTCADQTDTSHAITAPTPGHDYCQISGIGSATMGLSCTSDDPPTEVSILVTNQGRMNEFDPSYCEPAFTAEAFEVDDPSRPSAFP